MTQGLAGSPVAQYNRGWVLCVCVRRPRAHDVRGPWVYPLYYYYSGSAIVSCPWTWAASRRVATLPIRERDRDFLFLSFAVTASACRRAWRPRSAGITFTETRTHGLTAAGVVTSSAAAALQVSTGLSFNWSSSFQFNASTESCGVVTPEGLNASTELNPACLSYLLQWQWLSVFSSVHQFGSPRLGDSTSGKWLQLQIYSSGLVISCRDLIF